MRVGADTTVLVTGGASGIGLGIVRAFAARGARVVAADLDLAATREAVGPLGDRVEAVALDVRDRDAWAELAVRTEREGGVDILVANAGVGFLAPALEASFEQWDWVLDINLTGVYNGIRTLVPGMLARGRLGHVVATASIGGLLGARGAVYAAAKFGVVGLLESLRAELLGTPIGTSLLAPGLVRTGIADGPLPPGGRPVDAPDPEPLMAHALSPESVGELVLAGIEEGRFHLLTHAEHGELLERRFAAIRRAVPPGPAPAERAAAERAIFDLPIYDAPGAS